MVDEMPEKRPTLALSTKVEEDFVAPLTAIRGALEILRDYPDLEEEKRHSFLNTALRGCRHLEKAVAELADTVYAAGNRVAEPKPEAAPARKSQYDERISIHEDLDVMEVDFSNLVFTDAHVVDAVHDAIEAAIRHSGRKWFLLINYDNCSIWPEAWVAFAHRGKKINLNHSRGTVRYAPNAEEGRSGLIEDLFPTREKALARIEELRAAGN
jgi:hypothetical protein